MEVYGFDALSKNRPNYLQFKESLLFVPFRVSHTEDKHVGNKADTPSYWVAVLPKFCSFVNEMHAEIYGVHTFLQMYHILRLS